MPSTSVDTKRAWEWCEVSSVAPTPHTYYLVHRAGWGPFVATPCYGVHEPWWVPCAGEAESPYVGKPTAMRDGDVWTSWDIETDDLPAFMKASADEVDRITEERDKARRDAGELLAKQNLVWKPLLAAAKDVVDNPEEYRVLGDAEHHARTKTLRERVAACEEGLDVRGNTTARQRTL